MAIQGSEDNYQTKHKDENVNSNYSKDEILLFIDGTIYQKLN